MTACGVVMLVPPPTLLHVCKIKNVVNNISHACGVPHKSLHYSLHI